MLPIDSLRAAFVGAFLDDNSDCVKVTGVACSEILDSYCDPSWQEDDYPIEISEDLEVEYGLVWGVLIEVAALGPGTYVLNSLELTHSGPEVETDILVTFELGARQPLAFDFDGVAFTIAPPGFPANLPDWLYVGDANSNNPPFIIHKVLESPACDGDANGDGVVDPLDSGYVLARFGCPVGTGDPGCDAADQNGDGVVDPLDSGYVLARFGECP